MRGWFLCWSSVLLTNLWSAVTCYRFGRPRLVATHALAAPSRRVTKRRRVAAIHIRALPYGRASAHLAADSPFHAAALQELFHLRPILHYRCIERFVASRSICSFRFC